MTTKSAITLVLLLSLAAGCASFENRTGAGRLAYAQDETENAVIILSVGAAEKCFSFVTRLKLLRADSPYNGPVFAFLPVDSYVVKSDFTDHHGYLHVLRLKPGNYYFAPYINNPALTMKQANRADFSVSAGEVVYMGEYFLHKACGYSGSGTFRDQSARDFALLKKMNPTLAQAAIQTRILRPSGQIAF